MMASIFCSVISRRAFSSRALRSSAVIGFARVRIDVSAAMLGGTGPAAASPPRPRCADTGAAERPAAAPLSQRNDRRDNMGFSLEAEAKPAGHVGAAGIDGQRIIERDRSLRERHAESEAHVR